MADTDRVATRIDYDAVAPRFDRRYRDHDYRGVTQALLAFVAASTTAASPIVLEVGCGTGHWLRLLGDDTPSRVIGLDLSMGMLAVARQAAPAAALARASADSLPLVDSSLDAVFCINALHHFADAAAFIRDARRVLRPGGGLFMAGLDPHAGVDSWWLYDAFPEARDADLRRYPAASELRRLMADTGFDTVRTDVVQRWSGSLTGEELVRRNMLDRTGTSQLMVIPDAAYDAGVAAVKADLAAARATNLHVYATTGVAR